jgi:hypothetical protein
MRPTDVLMHEHRVIEQVIDCLEAITNRHRTRFKRQHQDERSGAWDVVDEHC